MHLLHTFAHDQHIFTLDPFSNIVDKRHTFQTFKLNIHRIITIINFHAYESISATYCC